MSAVLSGFLGRPTRSTALSYRALGISGSTDPVDRASIPALNLSIYFTFSLSPLTFNRRSPFLSSSKFHLKLSSLNPSQIPSKPKFDSIPWCWIFVFRASSPQNSKNFKGFSDLGFVLPISGKNPIFTTVLDL